MDVGILFMRYTATSNTKFQKRGGTEPKLVRQVQSQQYDGNDTLHVRFAHECKHMTEDDECLI